MLTTALIFFTRLPIWRWVNVPSDNFKRVIYYWPFAGWVTASTMIATLLLSSLVFPPALSITLTLLSRVILTGALHEDGLADFLDGFGGGHTKEKILAIMKDSHAGTYAIVGLIGYFLLSFSVMQDLPLNALVLMLLMGDPLCKMISSFITARLSYARTVDASKIQAIYDRPTRKEAAISLCFGLIPLAIALPFLPSLWLVAAMIAPVILFFILTAWMAHKINGYTGDCAGALFLLLELSFRLSFVAIYGALCN